MQSANRFELTYIGQAGLILDTGLIRIVFDPYLSNFVVDSGIGSVELFSRAFPPPVKAEDLSGVDVIFISHDHADHCDPDTLSPLYKRNPAVRFICPRPVANHLQALGIQNGNILVPQILELLSMPGLEFHALPAAHYGFDRDMETREYAYFGFVVKTAGRILFHAGDTISYPDFAANILQHSDHVDIACLPINGRDEKRENMGIVGNLNGDEAYALAKEIKSRVLIPMHNDLFLFNSEDPRELIDLARRTKEPVKLHWMKPGDKFAD